MDILEEKEKRRDQFQREVDLILQAERLRAEEKARHETLKRIRQGYVDNAAALPATISVRHCNEQSHLIFRFCNLIFLRMNKIF